MATRGTPRPTPRPICIPVDDEELPELDAAEEVAAAEEVDVCDVTDTIPADVVASDTDNDDDDDDVVVVIADVETDVLVELEEADVDDPTV